MVDFSPDVLAWKQFLLPKFGGWTKDYLCAFSELFNSLYTCHHQLSAYCSRKYLLDLVTLLSWVRVIKHTCSLKCFEQCILLNHHFVQFIGPRLNTPLIITVTSSWVRWCLKSPAACLFIQPFTHAQITENIKALHHWPLCREFTGDRWIPRTKDQLRGKCFHLITSSCFVPGPIC